MTTTVHCRVTGRVQGVGFRAWTQGEAERLGVSGWVRNAADGSVEALVSGEGEAVAAMLAALHRGPRFGRVDRVETAEAAPPADAGFRILR